MNPLSAGYFIKHNKARVSKIIIIISMISLVYVGGLYLTNINEESLALQNQFRDFAKISSSFDDIDMEQFNALGQRLRSHPDIEIFNSASNFFLYKTMLGFRNGGNAYVFSVEDFKRFNARKNIISPDIEISGNTLVLSEKMARYLDLNDGDLLQSSPEDIYVYYGEYPFEIITFNANVFTAFFVLTDFEDKSCYLITWKEESGESKFYKAIEELKSEFDKVDIVTHYDALEQLHRDFGINNIIYSSIIVILSVVFAITTNAVFIGIYDKRKQEFAFYKGIGIPRKAIYRKVAAEILFMNGAGLVIGTVISMLTVTLLNSFIYHKDGLSMWYYHPTAFTAAILCDLAILIPGIGLRIRNISKEIKDVSFL